MEPIAAPFHTNAPWATTGYGQQARQLVKRMIADGHRIMVAANYGLEATIMEYDADGVSIPVYPRGFDVWNNDIVGPYFDDWSAQHPGHRHMQFTLFDVWVFNSPRFDDIPTVSWVPIDHAPVPGPVEAFCAKPNVTPVAMSRFGERMLQDAGVDCVYIPHAIERVFAPTESVLIGGREVTGRQMMGLDGDDRFVFGMFAANKGVPGRKAWAEQILAFARFHRTHPDTVLYIHSDRFGAMQGHKLDEIVKAVGLDEKSVRFANQYALRMGVPQAGVAALMTACDAGLLCSMGEGFGIPAIELQGTGTPVIVSDFSAQPELVGDGWLVQGQPWWDEGSKAWFTLPLVESIVEAMEAAYARGQGRSQVAIDFVREHYDADTVYAQGWRPLLESL